MEYMYLYGFVILSCCIGLIIFLNINALFNKRVRYLFYMMTALSLILASLDLIEMYSILVEPIIAIRKVECIFSYIVKALYAVIFLNVINSNKIINKLSYLAFGVSTICSLCAFFTNFSFAINESNEFVRGPLNYIILASNFFVLFLIILVAIKMTLKDKSKNFIFFSTFCFLCVVASVLEFTVKAYGFINFNMVITVIFYYIFLEAKQFKHDELTGINNRLALRIDIEKLRNKSFTIISIDVNNLKLINDTFGHQAGDESLQSIVSAMKKVLKIKNNYLYRAGGDEFILIDNSTDEQYINKLIGNLKDSVIESGYQIAAGYSVYSKCANIEEIFKIADEKMYDDKYMCKNKE